MNTKRQPRNSLQAALLDSGLSSAVPKPNKVKPIKSKAKIRIKSYPNKLYRMAHRQDEVQGMQQRDYGEIENNCTYGRGYTIGNVWGYDEATHCYYLLAPDQRIHVSSKNPDWGSFHPYQENYVYGKEVDRLCSPGTRIRRIPNTDGSKSIDWEVV
jgi:hypothetical protein